MSSSVEELRSKNAELKKERDRLRKLVGEVESRSVAVTIAKSKSADTLLGEADAKEQATETDVDEITEVFHEFDANHSGFIERDELVQLAAALGELLDDEEVDAGMKVIDTSGDGKISLKEFIAWWTDEGRLKTEKDNVALNVLRVKLSAKYLSSSMPVLMRKLSERQQTEEFAAQPLAHHQIRVHVGDFKPVAKLVASLKFAKQDDVKEEPLFDKFSESPMFIAIKLQLKSDLGGKSIDQVTEEIGAILKTEAISSPQHTWIAVPDAKTNTLQLCTSVGFEVMEHAIKGGVDMSKFLDTCRVEIGLRNHLHELWDDSEESLAHMAAAHFDLEVKMQPQLLCDFHKALPRGNLAKEVALANLLLKLRLDLQFGDVDELISAAKPADDVDTMQEIMRLKEQQIRQLQELQQSPNPPAPEFIQAMQLEQRRQLEALQRLRQGGFLPPFLQPAFLMSNAFKTQLRALYNQNVSDCNTRAPEDVRRLIAATRQYATHCVQVRGWSRGGLRVTVDLDDMVDVQNLVPQAVQTKLEDGSTKTTFQVNA